MIYSIAAGVSLAGHAALIWLGGAAAVSSPLPHADGEKFVDVQFVPEQKPRLGKQLPSEMQVSDSGAGKHSSVVGRVEPERLFPAFYGVHYYEPKELTQKPLVTLDIPREFALRVPNAPENAAILFLLINEQGRIDKVLVESSFLPESAQAELEKTFKAIKFLPGKIQGVSVKSVLKIQVRLDAGAASK